MNEEQPGHHKGPSPWLPPREFILYDPDVSGRLETPTDKLGLVDLDKLVALVKQTVRPGYSWESPTPFPFYDKHHLQWPEGDYPPGLTRPGGVDMRKFRELSNRQVYKPRVFHNWAHKATQPAKPPSEEVMHYSIQASDIAKSLCHTARLATRLTRMPRIPENKLVQRLNEEYENYMTHVESARCIPEEFSLFAIKDVEAANVDEMLLVNKHLGRLALDTIPIRERQIVQAA